MKQRIDILRHDGDSGIRMHEVEEGAEVLRVAVVIVAEGDGCLGGFPHAVGEHGGPHGRPHGEERRTKNLCRSLTMSVRSPYEASMSLAECLVLFAVGYF